MTSILFMNIFVFLFDKIDIKLKYNIKRIWIIIVIFIAISSIVLYKINDSISIKETPTDTVEILDIKVSNTSKIYSVSSKGWGILKADVEVIDGKITSIIITDSSEETQWNEIEDNNYIYKVIESQNKIDKLDAVSGSTFSSNALKNIVILGLCPMLLSTITFETSYIMGLIVFIVILIDSIIFSLLKNYISKDLKLPIHIIITSIIIVLIQLFINNYISLLESTFKLTLPLLIINTIILNNMLSYNKEDKIIKSIKDNLKIGFTFLILISLFGLIKELLGTGTITIMDNISSITGYKEIIEVFSSNILPNKLFITNGGTLILLGILLGIINNLKRGEIK